jgi:hypothetical protein
MLWFVMIFLVTGSFVGALAIDYGQVLFARSQVQAVTTDAALRASKSYQVSDSLPSGALLLDEDAAREVVRQTMDLAVAQGAIQKAKILNVKVTFENNDPSNYAWAAIATENPTITPAVPRVYVAVTYEVTDLAMMDLFAAVSRGVKTVIVTTMTKDAAICVPGLNPDTVNGVCARSGS